MTCLGPLDPTIREGWFDSGWGYGAACAPTGSSRSGCVMRHQRSARCDGSISDPREDGIAEDSAATFRSHEMRRALWCWMGTGPWVGGRSLKETAIVLHSCRSVGSRERLQGVACRRSTHDPRRQGESSGPTPRWRGCPGNGRIVRAARASGSQRVLRVKVPRRRMPPA